MNDDAKQVFLKKLEVMRLAYSKELPDHMFVMQEQWRLYQQGQPEALARLAGLAHKVAGSAATFGYVQLTANLRALEQCANELFLAGTSPKAELVRQVEALLAELIHT